MERQSLASLIWTYGLTLVSRSACGSERSYLMSYYYWIRVASWAGRMELVARPWNLNSETKTCVYLSLIRSTWFLGQVWDLWNTYDALNRYLASIYPYKWASMLFFYSRVYNLYLFICFITVCSLPSTFPRYRFWIQCVLLRMLFAWIWIVTSVLMIMTFQASLAVPQGLRDDLGRLSTSWAAPNLCPDCGESMIFFSKEHMPCVWGRNQRIPYIFFMCVWVCVCVCVFVSVSVSFQEVCIYIYIYIWYTQNIIYVSNIN